MSAGSRWKRARSAASVSPVRTATVGRWNRSPRAVARLAMPAIGDRRLRSTSTASAFSGEMWGMRAARVSVGASGDVSTVARVSLGARLDVSAVARVSLGASLDVSTVARVSLGASRGVSAVARVSLGASGWKHDLIDGPEKGGQRLAAAGGREGSAWSRRRQSPASRPSAAASGRRTRRGTSPRPPDGRGAIRRRASPRLPFSLVLSALLRVDFSVFRLLSSDVRPVSLDHGRFGRRPGRRGVAHPGADGRARSGSPPHSGQAPVADPDKVRARNR